MPNKEGMTSMRRNRRDRKNSIRKERIVMIASSAFVLAALTMTGVYMKEKSVESKDDGYSVDFAAIEENVEDKYQEIAQIDISDVQDDTVAQNDTSVTQEGSVANNGYEQNMENDLDYMPLEAGSSLVEIPGLTEGMYSLEEIAEEVNEQADLIAEVEDEDVAEAQSEDVATENIVVTKELYSSELHFSEEENLIRPTAGEILLPYSMDGSIYFATLDQYKYNPAIVFAAGEGTLITACAEGKVVDVFEDAQIGKAVTVDLGDGYQITYGQLEEIQVSVDSYVNPGDAIGSVAAPTKYYSVEGSNLYLQMTKDGEPINPENFF